MLSKSFRLIPRAADKIAGSVVSAVTGTAVELLVHDFIGEGSWRQSPVHSCMLWPPPQTAPLGSTLPQEWYPREHLAFTATFLLLQPVVPL